MFVAPELSWNSALRRRLYRVRRLHYTVRNYQPKRLLFIPNAIKFTRLIKVRMFTDMPSYFPASHEALSPNFAFCAYCFLQSRICAILKSTRNVSFKAKETLESNGCRKSCNKSTWNVEWHRWFIHRVVVFVSPQELVLLIIKLRNTRLSFLSWRTKENHSCDVVCILYWSFKISEIENESITTLKYCCEPSWVNWTVTTSCMSFIDFLSSVWTDEHYLYVHIKLH